MSLWIGRKQSVGIGVEIGARGTGVLPSYWFNCLSFTFKDVPTRALSEAGFGGIWGGDQAPTTLTQANGDMEIEIGDASFGVLLMAALGTTSKEGPIDGAAYKHHFSLQNDNQHDSLTIQTYDPIGTQRFIMAMIDVLELRIVPDAIVSAAVTFVSKESEDWAYTAPSYKAEKKFLGRNLSFKIATLTSGLAAASASKLKSLTLRIEKNVEAMNVLSTIQPDDIVNKRFNITGEIVMNYEDRSWLNLVKAGAYRAVRINLVHDDTVTGSAATKYEFLMDLSKVEFEAWEPDLAMDDITTQTLTFHALFDAGLNDNVINACYLVNARHTNYDTVDPSTSPSISPSISPSFSPSISPSVSPSVSPSESISPSISPSVSPSESISPSISPSVSP